MPSIRTKSRCIIELSGSFEFRTFKGVRKEGEAGLAVTTQTL